MVRSQRILVIAWAIGLATCAIGQGGQQGGFGGGGGGNFQGETRALILTPGQVAEWDLKLEPNEYIVARASSQVFDPVIQIRDKDGKVLKENDDVELGEQDAVVSDFFPKGFEGKVIVKCFKEAAGGPFQLDLRRSKAMLLKPRTSGIYSDLSQPGMGILDLKKDKAVYLSLGSYFGGVYEPNNYSLLQSQGQLGTNFWRFVPRSDGLHTYPVTSFDREAYVFMEPVHKQVSLNTAFKTTLESLTVDSFSLDLKEGQVISIKAKSEGRPVLADLFATSSVVDIYDTLQGIAAMSKIHSGLDRSPMFLIPKTGKYDLVLSSQLAESTSYELLVKEVAQEPTLGKEVSRHLPLSHADHFRISGKTGDRVRVSVRASGFVPHMELFATGKGRSYTTSRWADGFQTAVLDTLLTDDCDYVVSVASYGGGGQGDYTMKFELLSEPALQEKALARVGDPGNSTKRIVLQKGQMVLLHFPNPELRGWIRVKLKGTEIPLTELDRSQGHLKLAFFKAPESGSYFVSTGGIKAVEFVWTTIQSP